MEFTAEITSANEGLKATLDVLFKHTADVFMSIVDVISEKYKIDKQEMLDVIKNHPKYTGMELNPVLKSLEPPPKPSKKPAYLKKRS